jgi:hypothetical protein
MENFYAMLDQNERLRAGRDTEIVRLAAENDRLPAEFAEMAAASKDKDDKYGRLQNKYSGLESSTRTFKSSTGPSKKNTRTCRRSLVNWMKRTEPL